MSDAGNLETADVVRQELRLFLSLADRIGIDGDRQRRFLRMSQGEWQQLLGILRMSPCRRILRCRCWCAIGYLTSRLDRAVHAVCV